MRAPDVYSYANDIHAVDARYVRPGLAASHLVVRDGHAAFVDTGANASIPGLLAALEALGTPRDSVDYVLLTHIHLDHAGGAGLLMESLPNATLVVHPRGAEHLVDPARLEAGTRAVYGDRAYETLYGSLVPVSADRLLTVKDGETLALGRSRLHFLHTPGHALHHVAIHDETANAVFAGDVFGISYRIFDNPSGEVFVFPTTTPTQFDPVQMHDSIDRLAKLSPQAIYLTHFGEVAEIDRLAADLHTDIERFVEIAETWEHEPQPEEMIRRALHDYLAGRLAAHGTHLDPATRETWLAMDVRLNAAGLVAWRTRLARRDRPS